MKRPAFLPDNFTLLLVATVLLATFLPAQGGAARFFDGFTTFAIGLLFFLHGAKLSRDAIRASEIQTGDMIFAAGNVDAKKKTVGAAILIDIPSEEVRKAREGLGKTWTAGKITAITGTKIETQRLDGVEQKIAVDENTSFREKHDSVTLADLRPGEGFRAEGHVMNGTFTATTLTVFDLKGHEPWLDAGSEGR